MKQLPNALTCLNLFSGCIGVFFAFHAKIEGAALCILLSGIFDFFDGFAARLLKVKSAIGKELDSLADVISFGLLPAVVLFQMGQKSLPDNWQLLAFAAFLVTVFSALRLAKFNIDDRQTTDFIGLNTPTNTFFIISLPFIGQHYPGLIYHPVFLFSIVIITCWLLVSKIRLFSLKFNGLSWQHNKYKFIFLILCVLSISLLKFAASPVILVFYILFSYIHFSKET
ncbi:CDP-diacylglycerol---serine O-phosphatidyltransferase [bacterium A37T11]|nr:CDP-diacylglycerol---serine O-phosphatidyltransferase [bacterium A37T11]